MLDSAQNISLSIPKEDGFKSIALYVMILVKQSQCPDKSGSLSGSLFGFYEPKQELVGSGCMAIVLVNTHLENCW